MATSSNRGPQTRGLRHSPEENPGETSPLLLGLPTHLGPLCVPLTGPRGWGAQAVAPGNLCPDRDGMQGQARPAEQFPVCRPSAHARAHAGTHGHTRASPTPFSPLLPSLGPLLLQSSGLTTLVKPDPPSLSPCPLSPALPVQVWLPPRALTPGQGAFRFLPAPAPVGTQQCHGGRGWEVQVPRGPQKGGCGSAGAGRGIVLEHWSWRPWLGSVGRKSGGSAPR